MTYAIPKQSGQQQQQQKIEKKKNEENLQTLNRNRDKILSELVWQM